jgi:hypothetical protein
VEYSGAGEGKPLPMVIQTRASSIDRGACIKDLSQYPGEVRAQSTVCVVPRFLALITGLPHPRLTMYSSMMVCVRKDRKDLSSD